jgi:DNA topoisomerase-1
MKLVIVESPTKAKTISKFLPRDYKVESSFGHIRDLPQKELGVDTENDFKPKYVVPAKAEKHVERLKALAKNSSEILFASDEDREGEAISWHLKQVLKPKVYQRITFHEITEKAILDSLKHPREIDMSLVDAQQARRILDRLVGYELSPFLWKKIAKGLSAGRVQSVAVRLVVEREREIQNFKKEEFWTLEAKFDTGKNEDNHEFEAKFYAKDGKPLKKFDIKDEESAKKLVEHLNEGKYKIVDIKLKDSKKKPPEPFRTSTLQQSANQRLGMSSAETMKVAQELYEGIDIKGKGSVGLITYMRTDSLNLSEQFLSSCKEYINKTFGPEYAPKISRKFKTTSKGAQEAHEAIRPTHAEFSPEAIKDSLTPKQNKLYSLIWRRTVAGQMTEALIGATTIDIANETNDIFRANGQTIKFDGFLKVYKTATEEKFLPTFELQQPVDLKSLDPKQHFTEPPPRFTEEYGIGRPSTYAPTLTTIQDRNYVVKEEKKFKPTDTGIVVNDLLVEHFPEVVNYQFTANMEKDLDEISEGKKKWIPVLSEFYKPFKKNLLAKYKELKLTQFGVEKTDEKCEKCGSDMIIRLGKFGKFMACSNYPTCKNTKPVPGSEEAQQQSEPETTDEVCEKCGAPMQVKHGRFGKFLGCSKYPECKTIKSISQKTGVQCPLCEKGEIVGRRGKSGKTFYGCNAYPDCKFILWDKPTGEKCVKCGSLMVQKYNGTVLCSNKTCTSATSKTSGTS